MFLDWKESVLSKGKLGLKLSEFQEKYNSILDFKTTLLFLFKRNSLQPIV
jgi:nucleoside-triphosphatase THEP1